MRVAHVKEINAVQKWIYRVGYSRDVQDDRIGSYIVNIALAMIKYDVT